MARGAYTGVNESLYDCSLEDLGRRNRMILMTFAGGLAWAWMFIEPLNVQWFFEESWLTYNALGDESLEGEVRSRGGIWWSLLGTLLVSVGLAPLTISFVLFTYRSKGVTEEWLKNVWTSVTLIPIAAIWALLWLVCLPVTWWLLPWGEWSMSWWKIFPFLGLGFFGGFPLLSVSLNTLHQLTNPKYIFDEGNEGEAQPEEGEESSSTSSESTDPFAGHRQRRANVADVGSEKTPKPSSGSGTIVAAFFALVMIIPGIVLLIVGGVMAEEFIEDVPGFPSYTLEIIDEDSLGDQGFIIFIPGTPGDFNGNGMHDYCENVIVNATHSGAWMSDPWTGWSSYNEADETRQVFELEISHEGSGCDAQHWPKEKWINDGLFQLVKLGRACNGCMAGNTTITAEYANEPQPPVGYDNLPSMWIQDGEKVHESTTMTVIGAILTGISLTILVTTIIVKISKSKAAALQDPEGIEMKVQGEKKYAHSSQHDSTKSASITPSKSTYKVGEGIDFSFTAPKLPDNAWIGIVPVEIPHGDEAVNDSHDTSYEYLGGRTNGRITLPNPGLGTWTLRLHDTDNNGREIAHVVFEVSSHVNAERLHQGHPCEIHILEATEGKPIRFNVNNRPRGNDAWFGLYPEQATDQEHGIQHQTWMYFRDVGQNELSLSAGGYAAGKWSIRVFSDGGYNQIGRLDFEITDNKSSDSAKKIQSAVKGSSGLGSSNFWDKIG